MQESRAKFISIVVLTVVFLYLVAPIPNKPTFGIDFLRDAKLNLGIDLAGGAELTYRVLYQDMPGVNRADLTKQATDVIRHRIQQKQLKEPIIRARGDDQIIIQLAGVDRAGLEDYKALIAQAGKLELFASASKEIQERYNGDAEKKVPANFKAWKNDQPMSGEYAHFGGDVILLKQDAVIEGKHVATASHRQQMTPGGGVQWVVSFELTVDGAKLFDEAAKILFHEKPSGLIAIVLDGEIISKPTIESESFHGSGVIRGHFDDNGAKNLAIILRSGSLPAPIGRYGADGKPEPKKAEAETFVGPTLGQDAIQRGLMASGLTLAAVALFMIIYYRSSGFISVISVALNLVYLLGIMTFFGATLTLPGIAGIVLTVGMAVDANILIYERIREEQAKGKSAVQAFDAGHERAFSAIVDSNITTLIAGVVLYYFGTGPVQGFAVTLSIGILTTLFTVLFCAKIFLKMQLAGGLTQFKMMQLFSTSNMDFIRVARACVLASTIAVVGGTAFFLARGEHNFGIDFKGGSMLSFGLAAPQDMEVIHGKLVAVKGADNQPKYPDIEVQTVAEPGASGAGEMFGRRTSRNFQLRTRHPDVNELKDDVQKALAGMLSHEPFEEMKAEDVDKNPRLIDDGPGGPGWFLYVKGAGTAEYSLDKIREKASAALEGKIKKDSTGKPAFLLEEAAGAPAGLQRLKLTLTKDDSEAEGGQRRRKVRDAMAAGLKAELALDPFTAAATIGPAVATELKNSTIWAMIISWVLMIVYVAVRFASWRYGVAAVLALVHDALLAIAFTSLAGALIPKSWGLSFEMNLTTMAAILTVIGYSINDTIVVFDRIRENLILMKKSTFTEVINASVNQTLSRTVLTSFTVWISAVVLYVFTMSTGGGIAEFAFPLIIGVVVGTYSSIWIASPIVLWWYRGQKPQTA